MHFNLAPAPSNQRIQRLRFVAKSDWWEGRTGPFLTSKFANSTGDPPSEMNGFKDAPEVTLKTCLQRIHPMQPPLFFCAHH